MTRIRLRPKHSDEDLEQIYAKPHDHTQWEDHRLRVDMTIDLARWMMVRYNCTSIADLSAGNATIVNCLVPTLPNVTKYLGDFAPGYEYTGPIEKTIHQIPNVDMFICSETIEHLDDPDEVLYQIGQKADTLIVSTPINETIDEGNIEHYWSWSTVNVVDMLENTGWDVVVTNVLELPGWTYDYQIHACRRRP